MFQSEARGQDTAAPHNVPSTAPPRDPASASLAPLADSLDKAADTVVADVNGTQITLGMVADRLRDMPPVLAALPTSVVYQGASDDVILQRALALKARDIGLNKDAVTIRRTTETVDQELGRALVRKVVAELVTEDAVKRYFEANPSDKPGPEDVRFRTSHLAPKTAPRTS